MIKKSCPECQSIVAIDETIYRPGEIVKSQCQLCGTEIIFEIPVSSSGSKTNEIINKEFDTCAEDKLSQDNKTNQSISEPALNNTIHTLENSNSDYDNSEYSVSSFNDNGEKITSRLLYSIILVIIIIGVFIWTFRSCSNIPNSELVVIRDTVYVSEDSISESRIAETTDQLILSDYSSTDNDSVDTDYVVAVDPVDDPEEFQEVTEKIFVPLAEYYNSSEAYEVYPSYITDEKIGEDWKSSNIVRNSVKAGEVNYYVSAFGDIEGYPLSFEAVRLKNNRLYGRYHNDYNGVKLDVNGIFDSDNNLVIKLGHKSETSYWVLMYCGTTDNGRYLYKGTWGKKNKSTSLRMRISR